MLLPLHRVRQKPCATQTAPHASAWPMAVGFAFCGVLLGYTLQISNGTLQPEAFRWAIVTALLSLGALTFCVTRPGSRHAELLVMLVMGTCLVAYFAIQLRTSPGVYLRVSPDLFVEHHAYVVLAAIMVAAALVDAPVLRGLFVPAFLAVFSLLGLWLIKTSPTPSIDVWHFHVEAYEALVRGQSPYSTTIPNIYGHTRWYGPGLADLRRVYVGYPYPPLTLLFGAMGHFLIGDYRVMQLAAQTTTAGLIAYSRPGRVATTAAALFLFTPRGLFVLEQGWTESFSAMTLAATVFCACRFPKMLPWAFGAMLASKQYFVIAVPLLPVLLGTWEWRRLGAFLLKASVIPLVTILPFVAWDPKGFFDSVVMFQIRQPFRADALSVMAFTAKDGQATISSIWSFLAIAPPLLLALWRAPKTPAAFAGALSTMLMLCFVFAKQAFANYYYLVFAGFCVAVGACLFRDPDVAGPGLPSVNP
jgi:hypothetical protein